MRQRSRDALAATVPAWRISQEAVPCRSARKARRLVAVKSRTPGSPQISATTAAIPAVESPSSAAMRASRGWDISARITRQGAGSQPGTPAFRREARSWIQRTRPVAGRLARTKPIHPPSPGSAGKTSAEAPPGAVGGRRGKGEI